MIRSIRLLAGPGARAHIRDKGLAAADIAGIAAAAGGPKGLAFLALDEWLFGDWLAGAPRKRWLAGASIGAWRMAAAVHPDGPQATRRLGEAYLELQRYRRNPPASEVSHTCAAVVRAMLGDAGSFLASDPGRHELAVITARGRGALARQGRRRDFARAALANLASRERLGTHLQRVVFTRRAPPDPIAAQDSPTRSGVPESTPQPGDPSPLPWPMDDRFDSVQVPLQPGNLEAALLASGSIPLLAEAVPDPQEAPAGPYWDGGLIDYHLHWRWQHLDGLLLYPHFTARITPGWLDKGLPWRRAVSHHGSHDFDRALLVVPSAALLARLPGGRLPERQDFHVHGTDHDRRIAQWRRAMAECEAMVEDFVRFVRQPDPGLLEPLESPGARS